MKLQAEYCKKIQEFYYDWLSNENTIKELEKIFGPTTSENANEPQKKFDNVILSPLPGPSFTLDDVQCTLSVEDFSKRAIYDDRSSLPISPRSSSVGKNFSASSGDTFQRRKTTKNDQICLSTPVAQCKSASATILTLGTESPPTVSAKLVILPQKRVSNLPKKHEIPKFHFPHGTHKNGTPSDREFEALFAKLEPLFESFSNKRAKFMEMGEICKECAMPCFLRKPLLKACSGASGHKSSISFGDFKRFWIKFSRERPSNNSKLVKLLSASDRSFLVAEDFVPMVQDIVDNHVGLVFLRQAPEFHSRYIQTVISRIFYSVNRSWSGEISIDELNKSSLFDTLIRLDEVDDINLLTDFFSYEHFYVIYCKFWELDRDHDLLIDREDLERHNDYAISSRIIERIFMGCVTRKNALAGGKMSYSDFVYFLLSEEDKRTPTSIEYWFRCMDIDGDGLLSMFELEYFYEEQMRKITAMGYEPMVFSDVMCQMLDIIRPVQRDKIRLSDLKRSRMTPVFFDTFINVEKYLDYEQKESGFCQTKTEIEEKLSDWEKYAAQEYEALVAEEQQQQQLNGDSNIPETEINCGDSDEETLKGSTNGDILENKDTMIVKNIPEDKKLVNLANGDGKIYL